MSADSNRKITGAQAEEWFKQFSQTHKIAATVRLNLGSIVKLCETQLPRRLKTALVYSKRLRKEKDVINQILQRKHTDLAPVRSQRISVSLLDDVVATDQLIKITVDQQVINIAVDITINPDKEKEKIERIRGLPDPNDKPGLNRNQGFPLIRKALGIDKHLILILSDRLSLLPSPEKLLQELQAFAQGNAVTGKINLTRLKPQETISQSQPSAKQVYERLAGPHQHLDKAQRVNAIAHDSIQAGYSINTTQMVLLQDPYFSTIRDKQLAKNTALKIAENASPEARVISVANFLLKKYGTIHNGINEFQGKKYSIQKQGANLSITAKDGRGVIFQTDGQTTNNRLNAKDLKIFEDFHQSKQQINRQKPQRQSRRR